MKTYDTIFQLHGVSLQVNYFPLLYIKGVQIYQVSNQKEIRTENLYEKFWNRKSPTPSLNFFRNQRENEGAKSRDPFTKKPRKAVCIRMAAHSCLTALKSLGGARTRVATAATKESATGGDSEHSEAALWFPLKPFHEDPKSPEELLHSFHFLLLPPPFS